VATSVVLHGAAGVLLWAASAGAAPEPRPRVKSYAVNIVSPPPNQAGPEMAEPPMESPAGAPAPAAPAPAPVEEGPLPPPPGSEFIPPKPPAPQPAPPKREPAPAPQPTSKPPAPAPRQPQAAATPPAPRTAPRADTVMRRPAQPSQPARTAARGDTASRRPPGGLGTTGPGRRPVPATGSAPVASSAGGEGLNVRINGADFVDRAYLENIIRQVRRHFRPPADAPGQAEVLFWIERDGKVDEMRVVTSSGGFRFRAAALEAIEQAGQRGAFGPLPEAFPGDRLPISFYFRPAR
jgi:TonB family protein